MVTNEQTLIYRQKVSSLLSRLRYCLYEKNGRTFFPTDASIASMLGISSTAFSSISRQTSSMSGIVLLNLFFELSKCLDDESFLILLRDFSDLSDIHIVRF